MYRLIAYIQRCWALSSSKRFISYHRKKGIAIGTGVWIHPDRKSITIDLSRPSLVTIGNDVRLNKNFSLFTHDGSFFVLRNKYGEFVARSGPVKIGNNVYFGRNCSVLKGVTIGDNCIIAYGSVVTKDIPANSVAAGVPAKVISTLDDYFEKAKNSSLQEAFEYAKSIQKRFHRKPKHADFREEFGFFMNGDETHSDIPISHQLRSHYADYKNTHKAPFKGLDDFLKAAGIE